MKAIAFSTKAVPLAWGLLLILLVGCSSAANGNSAARPATSALGGLLAPIDGIPCESMEQLSYHVHAHLTILANGQNVVVPAFIGIPNGRCVYWLHTHDTTGVIHVEAPQPRAFTLGTFFDIWKQPLNTTQVLGFSVDSSHPLQFFVDGQPYAGDPRAIPLAAHTLVTIEYGSPTVPPPLFTFPPGL